MFAHRRSILATFVCSLVGLFAACEGAPPTALQHDAVEPALSSHAAPASRVEFAASLCPLGETPVPPRVTGKVVHVRDSRVLISLHGELEGGGFGEWDVEVNLETGEGTARGIFRYDLAELFGEPVEGGFEGRAKGTAGADGSFVGKTWGHGFGDLEGMTIRHSFASGPEETGFDISGVIVDPSGSLSAPDSRLVPPPCPKTAG